MSMPESEQEELLSERAQEVERDRQNRALRQILNTHEADDAKGNASAAEPYAEEIPHSVFSPYEAGAPSSTGAINDEYTEYRPYEFTDVEDWFFGVDFDEGEQPNQAAIDPDRGDFNAPTDSMPNEPLNVPQADGFYMPQAYSTTPAVSDFQTLNMLGIDSTRYSFDSENFQQVPMSRVEGSALSYGHSPQYIAYYQSASSTSAYPLSPMAVPLSPNSPRIDHPSLATTPSLVEVDTVTRDRRRSETPRVPQMEASPQFFQPPTQGQDVDEEDDDDEVDIEEDPDLEQLPLIPTYDGFKAHTRRLNSNMEPRYNWLVSRIAHQQEIRYKNLLDLRMKHTQATLNRTCQAGSHCLALDGGVTLVDTQGLPRDPDSSGAM
ncbi:hypothetical protein BDZ45DRAFT_146289 [Acephala macrosclerotiorum]|nr:hypothetical protein BDZ45DRAFT_146289 [Acephala macrosclerotiorum]